AISAVIRPRNERKMTKRIILMAAAAFALAAGAQAGEQKTGTVIVYRQWSFAASLQSKFPFNVDHGPMQGVRNGKYVKLVLPAGDHILSHDHPSVLYFGQDPQIVHVEAGKTVYFQYVATMALIF